MSNLELLAVPALAPAPYSYVAAVDRLVLTAGACPLDEAGAVVGADDPAAQARQVMANLEAALAAAGAALADVARTTVYVASSDRADLVAVWKVVEAAFGTHRPPSTLLGVAALGHPGQLVEVEATAVRP